MSDAQVGFNFVYIHNESDDHYLESVKYTWEGLRFCMGELNSNSFDYFYETEKDEHSPFYLEDCSYKIDVPPGKKFCAVMYANIKGYSL